MKQISIKQGSLYVISTRYGAVHFRDVINRETPPYLKLTEKNERYIIDCVRGWLNTEYKGNNYVRLIGYLDRIERSYE